MFQRVEISDLLSLSLHQLLHLAKRDDSIPGIMAYPSVSVSKDASVKVNNALIDKAG